MVTARTASATPRISPFIPTNHYITVATMNHRTAATQFWQTIPDSISVTSTPTASQCAGCQRQDWQAVYPFNIPCGESEDSIMSYLVSSWTSEDSSATRTLLKDTKWMDKAVGLIQSQTGGRIIATNQQRKGEEG